MNNINSFSNIVSEGLKYYVYALIDPRDGKIFYIGKGCGNRVFSHAQAALETNTESDKLNIIRDISSHYSGWIKQYYPLNT